MTRRKSPPPSAASIKAAADRAEGLPGDEVIQKEPVGRPTAYKPEYVQQVEKLCMLGATEPEIADFFGVNVVTIHRWSAKYPDFCNAKKVGKETADNRVERSLYQKATGYTFESEKLFQHQGEVIRAKVREHVPPSDTAMIFWLKNRRPAEWRDVHKIEHGRPGEFDNLSNDELRDLMRKEAVEVGVMSKH